MAREQITFSMGIRGDRTVAKGVGTVAAAFKALDAAVASSQKTFSRSFTARAQSSQQFTVQYVQQLRRVEAESEAADANDSRRSREWINRRRRRLASFRAYVRDQAREQRRLEREREKANRDAERLDQKRTRDQEREAKAATRIAEREAKRQEAIERASQTRRIREWQAFWSKVRGIAITAGAALSRTSGSLGLFGPGLRSSLRSVASQVEQIGAGSGKSFAGAFVKSLTTGLTAVPKILSDTVAGIGNALGGLLKTISGAITSIAGVLTLALGPVGAAISASVGAVLAGVTGLAGGVVQVFAGMASGILSLVSSTLTAVGNLVAGVADALTSVAKSVLSGITTLAEKVAGGVAGVVTKVLGTLGGTVGSVLQTVFSPVGLIIAGLSIKAAADIRDPLIDAFALLDDRSHASIQSITRDFQDMAGAIGVSANQIVKQSFDVISAGFRDLSGGTQEILERSAELAVAGSASVESAGRAVVTVLKALKLESKDAAAASKFLFDAQDRGRVTIQEVADNFGSLVPSMIAAKIPIEEIGAAFATLTLSGETAAEAATLLTQTILNLAAPTPEAARAARALGVSLRELSEGDEERLRLLEDQIEAEKKRLKVMKAAGAETRDQEKLVHSLNDRYKNLLLTSGRFVGFIESIRRIKTVIEDQGAEPLAFLRPILGRIRAQKGTAFLVENLETLEKIADQFNDSGEKFQTAIENSQQKVSVEVSKTVTELQRVGVALFDLGTVATGGRGFSTIRSILVSIRNGLEDLQDPLATFRESAIQGFEAVRVAVEPVSDAIGDLFSRISGPNLSIGFDEVLGIVSEIARSITGELELSQTELGALFDVASARAKLAFTEIKIFALDSLDDIKPRIDAILLGVTTSTGATARGILEGVTSAFGGLASAVGTVFTDLVPIVGTGLFDFILFGRDGHSIEEAKVKLTGALQEVLDTVSGEVAKAASTVQAELGTGAIAAGASAIRQEIEKTKQDLVDVNAELARAVSTRVDTSFTSGKSFNDIREEERVRETRISSALSRSHELGTKLIELEKREQELLAIEEKRTGENQKRSEALAEERKQREEDLRLAKEALEQSRETAKSEGQAIRDRAAAAIDARRAEADLAELRAQALHDVNRISRVDEKIADLAEEIGLSTKGQVDQLQQLFDRLQEIDDLQLKGNDRLESQRAVLQGIVDLAGDQVGSFEELAKILDDIANKVTPLTGLGNLSLPKPPPAPATTVPPVFFNPGSLKDLASTAITSSIEEQTSVLGEKLDVIGEGLGAGGGALTGAAPTSGFKTFTQQIFADLGRARAGVGGFVGQGNLAQGQGFIPLDQLPLTAVKGVFEQIESGAESIQFSTEALLQGVKELIQFRDTGELPGPQLGLGLDSIRGLVLQQGKLAGVTPQGLESPLVQKILEGLAGREAAKSLLDELGLSVRHLDAIEAILREQLQSEQAAKSAAAPFAAGAEKFQATGVIGSGPALSKIGKAVNKINQAEQNVDALNVDVQSLSAVIEAVKSSLAAQEAAGQVNVFDVQRLEALEAQLAQKQEQLAGATQSAADAAASLSDLAENAGVQELIGGLQAAFDQLQQLSESDLFPGLADALSKFFDTGEGLGQLADVLDKIGEDKAADFFKKAQDPESKQAKALELAKQQAKKAEQTPEAAGAEAAKAEGEESAAVDGLQQNLTKSFEKITAESKKQTEVFEGLGETSTVFGERILTYSDQVTSFAETVRSTFEETAQVLQEHEDRLDQIETDIEDLRQQIQSLASAGTGGGVTINLPFSFPNLGGGG